jgi:putative MATE family efflux protein
MKTLDISYKNLLQIAIPLSLGAFVQFLVVLTDNLFLARVSENALNGAGNGGMLYITAVMLGIGLSAGLQVIVARRSGEGSYVSIGTWLGSGLRIAAALSVVLFAVFKLLDQFLFVHLLNSASILQVMREFLDIRIWGLFVYLPVLMFNAFYTGTANTRILTLSMGITAGLNVIFDYTLIFGHFGFPVMEHRGAALATLLAEIAGMIFLVTYTFIKFRGAPYFLPRQILVRTPGQANRLLVISYPLMVQQVLALATWTTFYFLVEKVGGLELKVSHIVRNTYLLAFVTVMGFGFTTRTVISTLIAEHRQSELNIAIRRLIYLNIAGALILCHGLIVYPATIASLFFGINDPGVGPLTRSFQVVFFAVLIFSVTSILLNTIEGSGRTKQAMRIEILTIAIYLVAVYYVTIVNPQEIHVIWMTDYLYFGLLGAASWLYLRYSNWKFTSV